MTCDPTTHTSISVLWISLSALVPSENRRPPVMSDVYVLRYIFWLMARVFISDILIYWSILNGQPIWMNRVQLKENNFHIYTPNLSGGSLVLKHISFSFSMSRERTESYLFTKAGQAIKYTQICYILYIETSKFSTNILGTTNSVRGRPQFSVFFVSIQTVC